MGIEWINAISSILLTLLGGTASAVWFYTAKKREAAANATKAEAESIAAFADEWKELYEQRDRRVAELNATIDRLYGQISELRDQVNKLKSEMSVMQGEHDEARYWRCVRMGCSDRQPPHDGETPTFHPGQAHDDYLTHKERKDHGNDKNTPRHTPL